MTNTKAASWQNPRILLTLLIVFLCGASAGMLVMSLSVHRRWAPVQQPSWKESGKDISLQRFKKELDLTPEQTEQLETILDDFFTYYHTLQAQLDDVRASGKSRIVRILNPEQRRKFDKLMLDLQDKQLR
jgi:Spy/CpxP family protein refolding chaperone